MSKELEFYQAIYNGDLPKVKELIDQVNINWRNPEGASGFTHLLRACVSEHTQIVEYLLEQTMIDVNITSRGGGYSPLV